MTKPASPARVQRAITSDGHIRFAVLDASPLWNGVRLGHPHLEAEACACLVDLLSSTLLLQSRTFFSERLQLLLRTSGRAKALVADSWPDGGIRGALDIAEVVRGDATHASHPARSAREVPPESPHQDSRQSPESWSANVADSWLAAPGTLQVMRSNPKGQPYISTLEMVEGPIRTQVEAYLQQSEQIQASLSLWCDPGTGEAGGILLEPLPQCPPERLEALVHAIEGLDVVPLWERDPEFLCRWFNQGDGSEILAATEIEYRCRCSKESLLETLRGFGQAKLDEIFREEGPIEVRCDYCGTAYAIERADIPGPRHG